MLGQSIESRTEQSIYSVKCTFVGVDGGGGIETHEVHPFFAFALGDGEAVGGHEAGDFSVSPQIVDPHIAACVDDKSEADFLVEFDVDDAERLFGLEDLCGFEFGFLLNEIGDEDLTIATA